MDIAFGHTNMDLDCLGSLILVKKLFPGFVLVRSDLVHPAAKNLYTLYAGYFNGISPKDLEGEEIEHIIIVDTCMAERVQEYFNRIRGSDPEIRIFDHHILENCNILGARVEGGKLGANTSYLAKMAREAGVRLSPEEATIALTAIYADTGRLLYENVTTDDYAAAAWLLGMGGSLKLVRSFLETVQEDAQIGVLNQLLPALETRNIQGHLVMLSCLELEENIGGLAAVVEKLMDIKNPDAYFAVFSIRKTKTVLLIARSRKEKIDLHELLSLYGGGGHRLAGSAKLVNREGREFLGELCGHLEHSLASATQARDIMTKNVYTIHGSTSLMDASLFLERVDLTGVPVVDTQGDLTGFISLRDIMKGRKRGAMKAPVTAYMSKPMISTGSTVTMREIERIFFKHHIGHLPIVEDHNLLGIVTRWDYLEYRKKSNTQGMV
jgi:tRNA nucleotidyltransferase (CCA-adding enzyme)